MADRKNRSYFWVDGGHMRPHSRPSKQDLGKTHLARIKNAKREQTKGICEWPGCSLPGTQLHHCDGDAGYGKETLDNTRLYCANHHRLTHRWQAELDPRQIDLFPEIKRQLPRRK